MTNNVYQNGMPLWPSIDEIPTLYPWLSQKERCQVLILGGGITGAFTALRFAKAGVDTIVLSADPIGFGSTAACQGILLLFDAGKPCGFWVRTAQVISAHLCFAL